MSKTLTAGWGISASLLLAIAPRAQAALELSEVPLFLTAGTSPNVVLTLDDSGSMTRGYVPDSVGALDARRFTAASFNAMYYNPRAVYPIPTRSGATYSTSFAQAWVNGFDPSRGSVNLGTNGYRPIYDCAPGETYAECGKLSARQISGANAPAHYHFFYADRGATKPSTCDGSRTDDDCYLMVIVGSSDDETPGDSAAKQQNFANWYSFYRTRALATMSAAMGSVNELGDNQVRLGWQTLNRAGCTTFGTSCTGYDNASRENRIRPLDALKSGSSSLTHRTDFYDWLQRFAVYGATPLRGAMDRVGQYFSSSGVNSPYAENPYVALGTEVSCRRNFHVMLTDGLWNSNENVNYGGNADSTARTLPDGGSYAPRYPYRNPAASPPSGYSYSNSLSDIAFRYWSSDLRGDLPNNLAPQVADRSGLPDAQYWNPRNNPASWQHMVNFTISFGLGSAMVDPVWGGSTYAGDFMALAAGTKYWPGVIENAPGSATPDEHVYDLWHAAVNSRGQFFNADDPAGIVAAFKSVFRDILGKSASSAALAANSTSVQIDTKVFQAKFESADWSGQLIAYPVNEDGSIGNAIWDAAKLVPGPGVRRISSWNGSAGKAFASCSSDLSPQQQAWLNQGPAGTVDGKCQQRLDWLRGSPANEARNGGSFRDRLKKVGSNVYEPWVLGDMINSDPLYVQDENYGYASAGSAMPERSSYAAFVERKRSSARPAMVYIGANDGMLHGFDAVTGIERMAHVPAAVVPRLNRLMDRAYSHLYYVDGSPNAGDAYLNGSWKTVLVGGLGAGGQAVYALDVSDPAGHGPDKVLWEFTDAELGYSYSQPQIARLASGHWVAIFGNGYNSASDKAYLYVVDLATGARLARIPAGTQTGNGLSTPALIDADGDMIIDYAYAGDLKGNLWKFDLKSSSPSAWASALSDGGQAIPLFIARDASQKLQPITAKPVLSLPTGLEGQPRGGVMVFFGTGRYLSTSDPADTSTQSFYAIWDDGSQATVRHNEVTEPRDQLQVQTIEAETREFGEDVRTSSANKVDYSSQRGWYIDLTGTGERVISNALLRYNRIIFVTTIPLTGDVCKPDGTGWLMELDAYNGARTEVSVFDFTPDGVFDDKDKLASGKTASGIKSTVGMIKTPVWLESAPESQLAFKELSGTTGAIRALKNRKPVGAAVTRVFWRQIQ
ncbi:MAG: hypothetical protein RLZZ555_1202 [Pseudomonadota bacterium]|jgi:type IV pilus assembly protein PilY1